MCAVIQRGILGGFRNKIGNVVGTSWKGIAVMKALPLSVANPQTAAQTAQRTKFGAASHFASQILSTIVKPLWDRFAQRESGFNAFVKTNLDSFVGGALTQFQELIISKGTLVAPDCVLTVADVSAATLTITWTASPGGDANPDDEFYALAVDESTLTLQSWPAAAVRSDGGVVLDSTFVFEAGDQIAFYGAFRKADGTKVSNTGFDTRIAVA